MIAFAYRFHFAVMRCSADRLHDIPGVLHVHCARQNGTNAEVARGLLDCLHYDARLRKSSRNNFV